MRDDGGAATAPRLRYRQSGERLQRDSRGGIRIAGDSRVSAGIAPDLTVARMSNALCSRRAPASAQIRRRIDVAKDAGIVDVEQVHRRAGE